MLCRQFARSGEIIQSLSNNDGDGNKNGKKAIGLDWQNNNFARTSRFLYIALPSLHDYDVKLPIFMFCWGHKQTKAISDPLFFHVFMTKSEINTFTFCTNTFGQFSYISILNYFAKETDWAEGMLCRSFLNISLHKLRLSGPTENTDCRAISFCWWLSLSFILKQKLQFSNCLVV